MLHPAASVCVAMCGGSGFRRQARRTFPWAPRGREGRIGHIPPHRNACDAAAPQEGAIAAKLGRLAPGCAFDGPHLGELRGARRETERARAPLRVIHRSGSRDLIAVLIAVLIAARMAARRDQQTASSSPYRPPGRGGRDAQPFDQRPLACGAGRDISRAGQAAGMTPDRGSQNCGRRHDALTYPSVGRQVRSRISRESRTMKCGPLAILRRGFCRQN